MQIRICSKVGTNKRNHKDIAGFHLQEPMSSCNISRIMSTHAVVTCMCIALKIIAAPASTISISLVTRYITFVLPILLLLSLDDCEYGIYGCRLFMMPAILMGTPCLLQLQSPCRLGVCGLDTSCPNVLVVVSSAPPFLVACDASQFPMY